MLRLVGYPVAVQLGLPLGDHIDPLAPSVPRAPFVPSAVEFHFVRHQRARRYLLRVDGDGRVRVTIPRGGSRREATAFGLRHLHWIAGQRARIQRPWLNADERRWLQARANVVNGNRKLHTPGEDVSGGADILPVMPVGRVGLDAGSGATGVLANTRREASDPAVTLRLPHAVRPTLSSASADAPASGSCCPGC